MAWVALSCPQCSAPLPRVALWRSVKCAACGSLITKNGDDLVFRDTFKKALLRSRQGQSLSETDLRCSGAIYRLEKPLGTGEISTVYLARRLGATAQLVTIKISPAPSAAALYSREAEVLHALHNGPTDMARLYAARCLPTVIAHGIAEGRPSARAIVFQYPNDCWGSLADLSARYPQGLDPRHLVWIWRRILDVLHFLHAQGWTHGDVRPEHALVSPQNHGIRLIGWAAARQNAGDTAIAQDLMRSARVALALAGNPDQQLSSKIPGPQHTLLTRASDDAAFCLLHGAQGLDRLLVTAAQDAFGPPRFVPLDV